MPNRGTYIPESGMTPSHFEAFRSAAMLEGVIAVVRNTNTASSPLIARGCPGKPLDIKFRTDGTTGVVTAKDPTEVAHARGLGYAVVDADGVARGPQGVLRLDDVFWKIAPGQVIDVVLKKPVVGDYDLMGVFKPSSPGRNLALVTTNGRPVRDVMSPLVRSFSMRVNAFLDQPRVLHGAQDQFASFRGGATAFMPDGNAVLLINEMAVEQFYREWNRATRLGDYQTRSPGLPERVRNPMRTEHPPPQRRPGPGAPEGFSARLGGATRNQDALGWIGESLASLLSSLADLGIKRQVDSELRNVHADAIRRILERGEGVLVIVRMQEWARADFNGSRAKMLVGVHVVGGRTQDAALERWRRPIILQGPSQGWAMMAETHHWIPPGPAMAPRLP